MSRLPATTIILALLCASPVRAVETPPAPNQPVTYEAFGAKGDGKTDDLPAIRAAHAFANKRGLPVRSKPDATYHLGRSAVTAIIATDTDWGTSRFIIDDSQGVENPTKALFEVDSLLDPLPLEIPPLKPGQTRLDLHPPVDCLVHVKNPKHKIFIRLGLNQNSGTDQQEVFVLHKDGTIEGAIDWDYPTTSRVSAPPIDTKPLIIRGGVFTNIANRMEQEDPKSGYWGRNLVVHRSNTVIEHVTHHVTGETKVGQPYGGFLSASKCAHVVFRDCVIDGRKTYVKKAGAAGKPVAMGTYGFGANLVVDLRMTGCKMGNDIHDRSRWGVVATNFMKNFTVEDCTLSRVDVHQGISGTYAIRRCTLGHSGINAIGRGKLVVEDTTIHANRFISFRDDYGSIWDGEVIIRNCRWLPPDKESSLTMFNLHNDGGHDFGYPCSMPHVVRIDGLFVDDSKSSNKTTGFRFFSDPGKPASAKTAFPYRLTEKIEIHGLKTASGAPPVVSTSATLTEAVKLIRK